MHRLERQPLQDRANSILSALKASTAEMTPPMSLTIVAQYGRDPFLILISCLLSLRSRDSMTLAVSQRLFERARTPQQLLALDPADLEQILYQIGFYRTKARVIRQVCRQLIDQFGGVVPATTEELLSLPGVGPKTANLVRAVGFSIPAICVDVHVHRIMNRLGLIATTTSEQTQAELETVFDRSDWSEINRLLVMWGQNICTPVSPKCSMCALEPECEQVGVTTRR